MTEPAQIDAAAPLEVLPPETAAPTVDAPINRFAIGAIIAAFVLPLAGIVVGAFALSQIRRTGERGRSLALAATVLSSLFTIAGIAAIVIYGTRLATLAGL